MQYFLKVRCLRSQRSEKRGTRFCAMVISGECQAWIYKYFFPPLEESAGVKMSAWCWQGQAGLHGLCLVRSLLAQNSVCRKIKVVEKKADKRYRQAALSDALIPGVITHWRAATWGQPGCSGTPKHTLVHTRARSPAVMSCSSNAKKKKSCRLAETATSVDLWQCVRRVSFPISKSD